MRQLQMFQKVEYGGGANFQSCSGVLKRCSEPFLINIYGIYSMAENTQILKIAEFAM